MESQMFDTIFGSWREMDEELMGIRSEWEAYLEVRRMKDFKGVSVRKWWIIHQDVFLLLSQIALEMLAISAMSTEIGRVFSGYVSRIFYH